MALILNSNHYHRLVISQADVTIKEERKGKWSGRGHAWGFGITSSGVDPLGRRGTENFSTIKKN